ncbi:MAG: MSEP-CTERM sorting domain-containing protein, partial [Pseudomonadales bacterium]
MSSDLTTKNAADSDRAEEHQSPILVLLIGFLLPQLALFALNLYAWALIGEEANASERHVALSLAGFEGVLLIGITVAMALHQRMTPIRWPLALASLIAHSAYLWFFLITLNDIIPDSVQPWILNEGNVGRWNVTLMMPGAFLSLYALSRTVFGRSSKLRQRVVVLAALIGAPVAWYLVVSVLQPLGLGQFGDVAMILLGTFVVVVFLGAIIRVFDHLIHTDFSTRFVDGHYLVAALLGLIAPMAGLALNREIPFPADFQSVGVYALTAINGLVLLLKPAAQTGIRARLFLRFLTFPFIAYFFLVFLPFLPLSILAILALGAGFLVLTPLALGLFQAKITSNDFRGVVGRFGRAQALCISLLGLCVLPGYFLGQALVDKRAIHTAIEHFYSHDLSADPLSESTMRRSAKSLVQLRDRKVGVQMPYIAGMYNAIVFGNLVLSDSKIERMHHWLTNRPLPEVSHSTFGFRGADNRNSRRPRTEPPNLDVHIRDVTQIA